MLSLMSAFAGGDGGLSIMLRSQYQLMHVAVEQLNRIQLQLADIDAKLSALPAKIEKLLDEQDRRKLTNEIVAAAANYEALLRALLRDPNVIKERMHEVKHYVEKVRDKRQELSIQRQGLGPYAAMVVPVACALEMAGETQMGTSRAVLISILQEYEEWLVGILSNRDGSISHFIDQAMRDHDALIAEAAKRWYPKAIGIEHFTIAGRQRATRHPDICLITGPRRAIGGPHNRTDDLLLDTMNLGRSAVSYIRTQNLQVVEDKALGVQMLANPAEPVLREITFYYPDGRVDGFGVENGTWCYGAGVALAPGDVDALIKSFEESDGFKTASKERAAFDLDMQRINFERGKIGYAVGARIVAIKALQLVRTQLKFMDA